MSNPDFQSPYPARVAVIGLGYVGAVTAACLADLGHTIHGVDNDPLKVEAILSGKAPFYEPGLEERINRAVAAGRLSASTSLEKVVPSTDIALICVGTPSQQDGSQNLDYLWRVCEEIRPLLQSRSTPFIVAVRSTVAPGTCEQVYERLGKHPQVQVVSHPEFLREGCAIRDFLEPALIIVGATDSAAAQTVAGLYRELTTPPQIVSLRTAEMVKMACNAFHAVKIGFANEIGSLAAKAGIDAQELMRVFCTDQRLNISKAYLRPGFAFGGSCLPKDLRALQFRAAQAGISLPLLESVLPSNEMHLQRAVERILTANPKRLGVIGVAFKEDTDDLRESPAVTLLELLAANKVTMRVFDPHIQPASIYGSNLRFLTNSVPGGVDAFTSTVEELTAWADTLAITQPLTPRLQEAVRASGRVVIDLTTVSVGPSGS